VSETIYSRGSVVVKGKKATLTTHLSSEAARLEELDTSRAIRFRLIKTSRNLSKLSCGGGKCRLFNVSISGYQQNA
jgi:hypothetical protein